MEEVKESVWSVVRQKNECEDKCVQYRGKSRTAEWDGHWHRKRRWMSQKRECYDGCLELQNLI